MSRPYYMQASKSGSDVPEKAEESNEAPMQIVFSEDPEVDERRHNVFDLMKMRWGPHDIAKTLDLDVQTVRNDIQAIKKFSMEVNTEDLEAIQAEVMQSARMVIREAYKGWLNSQQPETKSKTKSGSKEGEFYNEETEIEKSSPGDPRFLEAILKGNAQISEVSGAKKHKEVQINNNQQNNTIHYESPERPELPSDYDRWTKKPENADSYADVDPEKEVSEDA